MLRVAAPRLTDQMTVALPVYHPRQPGQVLVQAGFTLTQPIIQRIAELGISHLWVASPNLAQVSRYVNSEILARREELAQQVGDAFASAQSSATLTIDYTAYARQIEAMINELLANPTTVIYLDELTSCNRPLADHCLRVSYLSVLMGLKLDAYLVQQRPKVNARRAKEVINLGIGAALHDIGKLQLDPAILDRHLQGDDDPDIRRHVLLGYDMVQSRVNPTAASVVLHHHQAFDGSGYPQIRGHREQPFAPRGERIHIYARIAAVANAFDRLHHQHYCERQPVVAALAQLLAPPLFQQFDPCVIQALLQVVPPYAPGIELRLSDGSPATAIEHHPLHPCRPTVRRLDDFDDDPQIDLRTHPDLHVIEADGQDVEAFNFDLSSLRPALA